MFDAVTRVRPGHFDRRQRQQQFAARHAMRRHRPSGGMRPRHFGGQRVEILADHDHDSGVSPPRAAPFATGGRPSSDAPPITSRCCAIPAAGIARKVRRIVARRHLGHPGDTQRRQPLPRAPPGRAAPAPAAPRPAHRRLSTGHRRAMPLPIAPSPGCSSTHIRPPRCWIRTGRSGPCASIQARSTYPMLS